ncbi:hypothetical protein ACO0LM_05490 [Undibacterium sp. Di26W]|uniref:hypothetical protein n=1 Tax=Undibacterium sp. Di26W TaxID=3413035 RepID=UPI003BF2E600
MLKPNVDPVRDADFKTYHRDMAYMDVVYMALDNAMLAMQQQIEDLYQEHENKQAQRQRLIKRTVEDLLPGFYASTLSQLQSVCPGFVDAVVLIAFEEYRPWLGILPRPGSAKALATLQTRLAFYFDTRVDLDKVENLDQDLAAISEQINALQKKRQETVDIISVLKKAQTTNLALPAEVTSYIDQLFKRAVAMPGSGSTMASVKRKDLETEWRQRRQYYAHSTYHDNYAWYSMAHDFPAHSMMQNNVQSNLARQRQADTLAGAMLADSYLYNSNTAAANPVQYEPGSFSDTRNDADILLNTHTATAYADSTDSTQNPPSAQADLYDCNSTVMLSDDIRTDDSLGAYS